MKESITLVAILILSGFTSFAKDNTPKNYQHATYMGLHTYVAFSETRYLSCLLPSGCVTDQLIEAAATIRDDKGVEYTVPVPTAKDPIRQFAVGDSVQFRREEHHTKQLTLAQLHNRPLVPYPDTSQNVETYLFIVLPNGKEHKYDMGLSNPNDKALESAPAMAGSRMDAATAAGTESVDDVRAMSRKIMEHQATTLSDNVLRQMCNMDSGDHSLY